MSTKATIRVQVDAVAGRVSPYLAGACIEDVNHEIYGGLYSQLLFGESFEEEPMVIAEACDPAFAGLSGTVSTRAERIHFAGASQVRSWLPFRRGSAEGAFQHTLLRSRCGRYSQLIEFVHGQGEVGIENRGLNRWGLNLVQGSPYEGLLVLQAETAVTVNVALESGDGTQVYAESALEVPGDKAWHDLAFTLTPAAGDPAGRFAIKLKAPGAVWVDYAFLQPGTWGRFAGLDLRKDIVEGLLDEGLRVMRYGGFMTNTDWDLERRSPGSGYRWRKMIGPRQERPPYLGTLYAYSSNGFGIVDFVAFCEAAGFLSIPVINPLESPADVADLVEYLNGDASTPWGARRVADGHPAPYGLRYLQIGNEEGLGPFYGHRLVRPDYPDLFSAIADAVCARDPEISLVVSPWLYKVHELNFKENREIVRRLLAAARGRHVLWDLHVEGDKISHAHDTERFVPAIRAYVDAIDPQNQIQFCVLEENGLQHHMERALGHAHMINTIERMEGAVSIDCAANCLQAWQQNDNGWDQGQLFYTATGWWGMPPYYSQQMIARHYQPLLLPTTLEAAGDALDVTATRSDDGKVVVVKIVNQEEAALPVVLDLGTAAQPGSVYISCLSGPLDGVNSPEEPRRYAPVESRQAWDGSPLEHTLPSYSFTILQFGQGDGGPGGRG
jgi:alpha-L-arabinofuranosidase